MSIRHELFQSFIRMGGDNDSFAISMKKGEYFNAKNYNDSIKKALANAQVSTLYLEYDSILIKEISYRKSDALIVSNEDYQYNIEVGKIIILLYNDIEDTNLAVVEVFETSFDLARRVHRLGQMLRYECINFSTLPSNEKLNIYRTGSLVCVKFSYGLVRSFELFIENSISDK